MSFSASETSFRPGDLAFIIENNIRVTPVKVLGRSGEFYTVSFQKRGGAATLRESRLYRDAEEAEQKLPSYLQKSSASQPLSQPSLESITPSNPPETIRQEHQRAQRKRRYNQYDYQNDRSPYGI